MRFDFQNLRESAYDKARFWTYARCWLRFGSSWHNRRFGQVCIEWHIPHGSRWGVTIGGGDSGRDFGVTFSIPFLLTLYVTVENVFAVEPFAWTFEQGSAREIACYFYDWGFHWSIWVGPMASWSRDYPWCRWYRQHTVNFPDVLFGRQRCTTELLRDGIPLSIPMPEGVYAATAKVERRTWKRPRWFAFSRIETSVDVPKGIPFAGKGENSWDCDDDGLFGYGVTGDDMAHAIAHGVESVLHSRKRYGQPSADTIAKALQH